MNLYYVQYIIKNIKPEYLKSYFSVLEKQLRNNGRVNVKHSFIEKGNIYINVYVKEKDSHMAGTANLNVITSIAVDAINFSIEEDILVEIRKVELVKY